MYFRYIYLTQVVNFGTFTVYITSLINERYMIQDKKWSILIVLLFFIWGGMSYHWYTCSIKDFCEKDTILIQVGGSDGIKINKIN